MRRSLKLMLGASALGVAALAGWWASAELCDESALQAEYQKITDGMTLAEVRNVMVMESTVEMIVQDSCRVVWHSKNKSIVVRIPWGSSTVQGKELVKDNSMIRSMRWFGGEVNDLYCRLFHHDPT